MLHRKFCHFTWPAAPANAQLPPPPPQAPLRSLGKAPVSQVSFLLSSPYEDAGRGSCEFFHEQTLEQVMFKLCAGFLTNLSL